MSDRWLIALAAPTFSQSLVLTIDTITETGKVYGRESKSPATRRAYESDWKAFKRFAATFGFVACPANPQTVAQHVTALAMAGKSVSTIRRSLAAIAHVHAAENFENPTTALSRSARLFPASPVGMAWPRKRRTP